MAEQEIHGSTKCNPNKLHNLPTSRLRARLDWLHAPVEQKADRSEPTTNLGIRGRKMDGHSGSGRGPMADAAKEIMLIEDVLATREDTRDQDIADWTAELRVLLDDLDVPSMRRDRLEAHDIAWLGRNLHINNQDRPNFTRASRLVRKLLREMS